MNNYKFWILCLILTVVLIVQISLLKEIDAFQEMYSGYEGSQMEDTLGSLERRVETLIEGLESS